MTTAQTPIGEPNVVAVLTYLRRIRNRQKSAYATAYVHAMTTDGAIYPDPADYRLSYMAARGVHLALGAFWTEPDS